MSGLKLLIAKVQVLRRQVPTLADEDTWRAFLANHANGETSTRVMSEGELRAVVEALHQAGAPRQPSSKSDAEPSRYASTPQLRKIRAMWTALAKAGVVRNRSNPAMDTFIRNTTGQDVGALGVDAGRKVIEALKGMAARKGVALE